MCRSPLCESVGSRDLGLVGERTKFVPCLNKAAVLTGTGVAMYVLYISSIPINRSQFAPSLTFLMKDHDAQNFFLFYSVQSRSLPIYERNDLPRYEQIDYQCQAKSVPGQPKIALSSRHLESQLEV